MPVATMLQQCGFHRQTVALFDFWLNKHSKKKQGHNKQKSTSNCEEF